MLVLYLYRLEPSGSSDPRLHSAETTHLTLWWNDPRSNQFLSIIKDNYNHEENLNKTEATAFHATRQSDNQDEIIDWFSTLSRATRVIAYCRRFLFKTNSPFLITVELSQVLESLLKSMQIQYF